MARKSEVEATQYPGIVKRLSDDKYIVTLDLGRQMRPNKKTGKMEMKQCKTTKVVATLKEARQLQAENTSAKKNQKVSRIAGKILFKDAIKEFFAFYANDWSVVKRERYQTYANRCNAYLGDMDIRDIDTGAIETFFAWCREDHSSEGYGSIVPKTTQKIKTMLSEFWRYLKKNKLKYGINENVVIDADYGKIEEYVATILTAEELSDLLEYALKNENDYSSIALIGLEGLAGLRRGEMCGLQWQDVLWDKKLLDIHQQRTQRLKGWELLPALKGGNPDGKTRAERRCRYAALPDKLAEILKLVMKQQEIYQGRPVEPEDYVYRQKVDLVNNVLCNPRAPDKRFRDIQNRYNKLRERQGKKSIPYLRNHDLRHTLVSLCINNGVDRLQVSSSIGHKPEGNTTIKVYWHDDNNRAEMIECIDRLITTKIEIPNMEATIARPFFGAPEGRDLRNSDL